MAVPTFQRRQAEAALQDGTATLPCTGCAAVLAMRTSPSRMPRSSSACPVMRRVGARLAEVEHPRPIDDVLEMILRR